MRKLYTILILAIIIYPNINQASETNGTIEATNKTAIVCHDTTCTTPTPGIINFKPTGVADITITDTSIDGLAWGNELGWINLNPVGSEGIIVNPTTGAISGLAWSQVSGWINFRPTNSGTISLGLPIGVNINSTGEFYGWAWSGGPNGGWIKFDCANSACVKTDWRPIPNRTVITPPTNSSGSGGQITQIANGTTTSTTTTVKVTDLCSNLTRTQTVVPRGYIRDELSNICVPINTDYCPNIAGNQLTIPTGMTIKDGDCVIREVEEVKTPTASSTPEEIEKLKEEAKDIFDACSNLSDIQNKVPEGYVLQIGTSNVCIPREVDYCPNISGAQSIVPVGYFIENDGSCQILTPIPEDKDADGIVDIYEDDKGEVSDIERLKEEVEAENTRVMIDINNDGIGDKDINIVAFNLVDREARMLFKVPLSDVLLGEETYVDLISIAATTIMMYVAAVGLKFLLAFII